MRIFLIAVSCMAIAGICRAERPLNFNRDVRPILSSRCFQCHGPNEHDRQAELRLDRADGPDGAYRTLGEAAAISPGSIEDSAVWARITSTDDDIMPPPDSGKEPLNETEQDIIRRWIEQGAEYTAFWAFVPPSAPDIPALETTWSREPIDLFVLQRLREEEREPQPEADRRTLIRRLSLDLTGLPPTRAEIAAFLADSSANAYEQLVDRLLAKPQYGEHMARYWLDLVRFADTNGIHHDHYREMSPYRDWVIRAFNENLPYDEFVRYQLAGDLYPDPSRDQLVASGFNRLHLIIDRGTALPEESLHRNVVDRVTAVGTAFLGMTVQCAVCHDHKYDPFTMRDFYQLYAFFNNLDGAPETGGRQGSDFRRGLQPPYVSLPDELQAAKLADYDRRLRELRSQRAALQQQLAATDEAEAERKAELSARRDELSSSIDTLQRERDAFAETIPAAMVMKEKAEPRPAHILLRGAYDNPGERVHRDTPGFLPPMQASQDVPSRMDLANWFLSEQHPLTARVAVNRYWQQLFGVGIVKTSDDFGAQGDWPSHPELLDHLAVSFTESGWDVKRLMKQIVMSKTYRQTSKATVDAYQTDPDNRLLASGARFRLDAEVIRDQILATSGLLNTEMFGQSVKPPQPAGLWEAVTMPSSYPRTYEADTGPAIYRRSVYTFWKRGMPPPQMTILNAPTREACIARRERTNTPLQALLLLNETEYLKASRHLAHRMLSDVDGEDHERLNAIYETMTAHLPDAAETERLRNLLSDLRTLYGEKPELATALCQDVELQPGVDAAELAAWTMLVSTIYNLDIVKSRG